MIFSKKPCVPTEHTIVSKTNIPNSLRITSLQIVYSRYHIQINLCVLLWLCKFTHSRFGKIQQQESFKPILWLRYMDEAALGESL